MGSNYSRALVVDDDPIQQQVLTTFLANHGVAVSTAIDSAAAIDLLRENDDIDLILSDLHMPQADGIELIAQMKEMACRVPLVIISSADTLMVNSAAVLAQAHQVSFVGALPKPIDFGKLAKLLGFVPRD